MTVRALIVEDEPFARATLREMLAGVTWLTVIGEATDGLMAVRDVDRLRPDVIFLDVELPELSGIEVMGRVRFTPVVVFTTAFDQFAVSAFELAAVDYLLKPFGHKRLHDTLDRVRRLLADGSAAAMGERASTALDAKGPLDRFFVRDQGSFVPIVAHTVERLAADDDYVVLHVNGRRHLVGVSMNEMEQRLDPKRFVRIHRSHIVNLDYVAALTPYDAVRMQVEMRSGTRLIASRSSSRRLRDLAL
jgi:two-component system LytT family response regulator